MLMISPSQLGGNLILVKIVKTRFFIFRVIKCLMAPSANAMNRNHSIYIKYNGKRLYNIIQIKQTIMKGR